MMAVRSMHKKSHLQHAIVNRRLVDASKFGVHALSVSKKNNKKWPSYLVMAEEEEEKKQPGLSC